MKQLFVLAGCAIFLSGFLGCQNAGNGDRVIIKGAQNAGNAVQVTIEGGGRFPKSLVGTWKADKQGWEFVFRPDGTISSAVIDRGVVRVTPSDKVVTIPLDGENEGIYRLGQWTVQYSPDSRELAVKVVVDYFHLYKTPWGMKGNSTDWFVGPVSEDSQTWKAEWFSFSKVIAFAEDEDDLVFKQDPNENPIDILVFRKQEEKN
jgi:hypothetical protein